MSGRYEKDLRIDNAIKAKLTSLPEVVTEYYYSLLSDGKSYRTAAEYIDRVEKFIKFVFGEPYPSEFYTNVKPSHITRYISSLRTHTSGGKTKKLSDSYRTVCWSALNSFFQFLVPEYIQSNPVASTNRPKMRDNPEVTFLTEEEIALVLDNVKKKANTRMINRDLCILKIGFAVGIRVSEIVQIDIDDLDLKRGKIKITGKGDRVYNVFIGDNLKQQIRLWLKDRDVYFNNTNSNALFVSQEGNRISPRTIKDLIDKYTDVVDKHVTPHVMRHSCATNLYEKTGDIYLCAGQLNHKNVTTTQRYAELSDSKKKQATNILDNML